MSSFRRVVSITRPPVPCDNSHRHRRHDSVSSEITSLLRDPGGSGFSAIADPGGYGSVRFEPRPSGKYVFDDGQEEDVNSEESSDDGTEHAKVKEYKTWKEMWPICTGLWTA